MSRRCFFSAIVTVLMVVTAPAPAVILYRSADRNTSPPTGPLANSGWQWQGQFGPFLGTPISSRHFITAQHVGGGLGANFGFNGTNYVTDQMIDIPGTDLRVFRVSGTFPTWAPLFDPAIDGSEVGRHMVVFGRGTQRGDPIYAPSVSSGPTAQAAVVGQSATGPVGPANRYDSAPRQAYTEPQLKGWGWGGTDFVQSWGENLVSDVFQDQDFGSLLYFTFDADGLLNEAHLSSGDSGGGVFLHVNGQWKLAGINFSVDGPFRNQPTDAAYLAALFDVGGLYVGEPPQLFDDSLLDIPSGAYASAVSRHVPLIRAVVNATSTASTLPEPGAIGLAGIALLLLNRRCPRALGSA